MIQTTKSTQSDQPISKTITSLSSQVLLPLLQYSLEKGELCKLTRFSDYETSIISKDPNKNISLSSFIEFASIKIKTLSCNSSAVLAIAGIVISFCLTLSEDGTLYSWGNDDGTGVLGLGSFKYRPNPTIVDPMTRFKHVSISSKHASAIDGKSMTKCVKWIERGNLYTWGTGKLGELCDPQATFIAKPRRVDSSLLLSCQSSVCYKTVTAVITSGGSLTFFGQIGGEKYRYLNKTEPSLIQLGHTIYVVDVVVGDCFAAALTSIVLIKPWFFRKGRDLYPVWDSCSSKVECWNYF